MGWPKGKPRSAEANAKARASMLARYAADPEFKAARAAELRALAKDPQANAGRSRRGKERAAAGELAGFRAAAETPETKAKAAAARAIALGTPESRAKKSAAVRRNMAAGTWNGDFYKGSHAPAAETKRTETNRANGNTAKCVAAMNASQSRPEIREKRSTITKAFMKTPRGRALVAKMQAGRTAESIARGRVNQIAYANSSQGHAAKVRGGLAALRSLRGASGSMKWRYAGHRFRSSWEMIFAQFLDALGVRWDYEAAAYELSDGRSYVPDFHVNIPGGGTIVVEVKGQRDGLWRHGFAKHQLFRENYGVPTILLGEDQINAMKTALKTREPTPWTVSQSR